MVRWSACSPTCQSPVAADSMAMRSSSPARSARERSTTSAIGDRQMLPVHTNDTRKGCAASPAGSARVMASHCGRQRCASHSSQSAYRYAGRSHEPVTGDGGRDADGCARRRRPRRRGARGAARGRAASADLADRSSSSRTAGTTRSSGSASTTRCGCRGARSATGSCGHEQRWLPVMAAALPDGVRAPVPVAVGVPGRGLRRTGGASRPGSRAWSRLASSRRRGAIAALALADFVVAMGTPAPAEAPENAFRGRAARRARRGRGRAARIGSARGGAACDGCRCARRRVARRARRAAVGGPAGLGARRPAPGEPAARARPDGRPAARRRARLRRPHRRAIRRPTSRPRGSRSTPPGGRRSARESRRCGRRMPRTGRVRARWALAMGSAIVDTIGVDGPIGRIGAHALEQVLAD